jgi:acetyl-CoA acetyltransferase family protein
MEFSKSYIPYDGYWSTPFCRWQGSFSHLHALEFASEIAKRALKARKINAKQFEGIILGTTIPQKSSFYGAPWVAGMIGNEKITGATINQACATSFKCVAMASQEIELGKKKSVIVITCDRTSNGPHIYYPNPLGIGGKGEQEDWVWDNFGYDPWAKNAMIETAENVAKEAGITKEECDELTLIRYNQYLDALKDESSFHNRFMVTPIDVRDTRGKVIATVEGDEGVYPTTEVALAKLPPVIDNGVVTYGTQTYPADGNAGIIVCSKEVAKEMSLVKEIEIQILSYSESRTDKGFMAKAIVPASQQALEDAGITIKEVKAIKTHNPFAVNDIYFSREMGVKKEKMNNYGSSLIYGHPQGPTGARLLIELIEELILLGGGYGLVLGCAAGDTAASMVIRVET